MSTRDDIRAAFKRHGPLSLTELAEHCQSCEKDRQIVASAIATLRAEGKVKNFGLDAGNKPVYSIDRWPDETSSTAAERAPDRAPLPATTPSPARPADPPEEPMKDKKPVAERALDALRAHGPQTLEQLAKRADTTVANLYNVMGTLKKQHGVTKKEGTRPTVYGLPGKSDDALERGAELGRKPPKATPQKRAKKRKLVNGKRIPLVKKLRARPDLRIEAGITGAQFAINENGDLGIEKESGKMRLDPAEFARLREFIERTEPVWQGGK